MLAAILNVPRNEAEWSIFSFNHFTDHQDLIQAIRAQKGISLSLSPIEPMPFFDLGSWLIRHAQMHIDFNGTLGLPGTDLSGFDINDPATLQGWIWDNFAEHQNAHAALKI